MKRVVVVPCFDEARRIDGAALLSIVDDEGADVVFVDDGSADDTRQRLQELADARPGRASVLALDQNGGKGEAVRRGMLVALQGGADVVAYLDADLSTPVVELRRLFAALDDDAGCSVVLGARVARLGSTIERRAARHYLGRVFATAASLALGVAVYDTQCGAKAFRVGPPLRAALATPFRSRWAFDVELLARLLPLVGPGGVVEVPLARWRDVAGSRLTPPAMARAGVDLVRIALDVRRRR
jgi:glycosyltransferase involved in cell wall biosynthesis